MYTIFLTLFLTAALITFVVICVVFATIKDGEKVKFTYLIVPNPVGEHVISFQNILPPELDLHRFIDYNKQFEKSFVEPLLTIVNTIGWSLEEHSSLESLFE